LNATALKDYAYFLAYNEKNIAHAKSMAEKALELKNNDPDFIYTYAFVLFKNGEKDTANRWVKDAMKKFPDNKKLRLLDQEINKNE
jgi:predicted Zn-dependent protease